MTHMIYATNYGKEVLGSFQYYFITYMERLGHEVTLLRPRDGSIIRQAINKHLKPPDFILMFEGELWQDLSELKLLKVPKCWWMMDTFVIATSQAKWIKDTEPDCVFVRDRREIDVLKKLVNYDKFIWLPVGYDETIFRKMPEVEKKYDVSFVGWVKEERARWLNMFAEKGLKVFAQTEAPVTWGWKMNENFTYNRTLKVGYDRFSEIYNMAKIGWHWSNVGDITYRSFEITGCGTMCLSDRFDAIEDLHTPNKEIVIYDSEEEMVEKAVYYANSPKEREEIALRGYERALKDHTWKSRIDTLIKEMVK